MTTPTNRTPVRIARGTAANLTSSIDDIQEGEIVWDQTDNKLRIRGTDTTTNPPSAVFFEHVTASDPAKADLVGADFTGPITVGADTDGHDVKFFGNTTGKYFLWDESQDKLNIEGAANVSGEVYACDGNIWLRDLSSTVGQIVVDYATSYQAIVGGDQAFYINHMNTTPSHSNLTIDWDGNYVSTGDITSTGSASFEGGKIETDVVGSIQGRLNIGIGNTYRVRTGGDYAFEVDGGGPSSWVNNCRIDLDGNITAVDLTLSGDLTVNGTMTTIDTTNLVVEDPLIYLARNNSGGDTLDIGFYGRYYPSSTNLWGGLFRDASDSGKWKLFESLESIPTTTVDTSGTGYTAATLVVGTLEDSKGDVRTIPVTTKPSAYAPTDRTDVGKAIYIDAGGVTIDQNIFSTGDAVTIINNSAADQTITQGTGVTLHNAADAQTGNRTLAGRGMATIWFAAANTAYISGAGLS